MWCRHQQRAPPEAYGQPTIVYTPTTTLATHHCPSSSPAIIAAAGTNRQRSPPLTDQHPSPTPPTTSANEAAELVRLGSRGRLRWVTLAHLSENNNDPELALDAHRRVVGSSFPLACASRHQVSPIYTL